MSLLKIFLTSLEVVVCDSSIIYLRPSEFDFWVGGGGVFVTPNMNAWQYHPLEGQSLVSISFGLTDFISDEPTECIAHHSYPHGVIAHRIKPSQAIVLGKWMVSVVGPPRFVVTMYKFLIY